MLPTSNFKAFEAQSKLFDLTSPRLYMLSKRGFDGGARALAGTQLLAFSLATMKQPLDGIGQSGRAAQIKRALTVAVAVAEREVGSQPPLAADEAEEKRLEREFLQSRQNS